jgi:tryptophan synthase alpha chain
VSRIGERFAELAARGRKAVIPYIVAGDPVPEITVPLMHELVRAGADIIELGVPFSDPMSEGPVIQLAHERALAAGVNLRLVLDLVREFRRTDPTTPVLLMGYANPVEHMGYATFADHAAEAGVDGLLTVDIPPEEVAAVKSELDRVGMDNIFLIAPTTGARRMDTIVANASGFIYYVSLKGVTGAGHIDSADVSAHIAEIRQHTGLPVVVGFGIKDAASARAIAVDADGVVVGSALVNTLAAALEQGAQPVDAVTPVAALIGEIRAAVDSLAS